MDNLETRQGKVSPRSEVEARHPSSGQATPQNERSRRRVELLAPAGNEACLHAAVRAGADAVYLGSTDFSARQSADNFSLEALGSACDYAHLRAVKVYLTVNTLILPSEFERACELIRQAYRRGVDGFIIQDLGLASEIHRTLPEAELHASTQMNIHAEADVRAAAAWGASRITFARELSLDELAHLSAIAHELGMETECFAHGALCICYSGRCLLSSLVGGRSANRGRCAQACRLPYQLRNVAQHKNLPAEGDHLLSPKDLATIDLLPQLLETGVDSLKIEGRMKSPEYVFSAVEAYRRAIDALTLPSAGEAAHDRSMTDASSPSGEARAVHQRLEETFSRGFTAAYLVGDSSNEMMSYRQPNNRGAFLGRVSGRRGGRLELTSDRELHEGDLLGIRTNKGQLTLEVKQPLSHEGDRWTLPCTASVTKGDRVFRLRDASLRFVDDPNRPRVAVEGRLAIHEGAPLMLELATAASDGRLPSDDETRRLDRRFEVTELGATVEAARTKTLEPDEVRDHVNRLGSTPFTLGEPPRLRVELDPGVGLGFSQLHAVRRDAVDHLQSAIIEGMRGPRILPKTTPRRELPVISPAPFKVCVIAANPACARAARKTGADEIYVPLLYAKRGESMIAGQRSGAVEQAGYPKRWTPMLPVIAHDPLGGTPEAASDFDLYERVRPGKPVWVETLGQLCEARDRGALPELGPGIGVMNPAALDFVTELGARRLWLSPELALGQIQQLLAHKPVSAGIVVRGAAELMVTEHCLLMSQGPCNQDCASCPRRKSPHYLKDRKGYEMPVVTDRFGRSHLYNAIELDLSHLICDLMEVGVDAFMVDASLMNVHETTEAVSRVVRGVKLAQSQGKALPKTKETTTGHIFRGVASV